jgi:uncharacterized membrane protein
MIEPGRSLVIRDRGPHRRTIVESKQRHTSHRPSPNVNLVYEAQTTIGERLADGLARFAGSWTFIIGFCGALVLWVGLNSLQLLIAPIDPFPFVVLNLGLSCLAAIQAPVVLMCLNRQAARDRIAADLESARTGRAELDLELVHEKLDLLSQRQWLDLVALQQHQIMQLNLLLEGQGLRPLTAPPTTQSGRDVRRSSGGERRRPAQDDERAENRAPTDVEHRRPRVVDGHCHRARPSGSESI